MSKRVETGCRDCVRCTNSGMNELGRKSGRAGAAILTVGMSEAAMAFTRNCRTCGHKMSLHSGNATSVTTQVAVVAAPPAPVAQVAAGWYPDPAGSLSQRWWNGQAWTDDYAPAAIEPAPVAAPSVPAAGWFPDPSGAPGQRWWDGGAWTDHTQP